MATFRVEASLKRSGVTWYEPLSSKALILTTLEGVPGKEIVEHYGLVQGSTIRAKHIGKDILAGFKNIVGGELKGYTELLQEARKESVERMVRQAQQLGANAVVNVRFATSSVAPGAAELFAYGTAVKVR
ncbi:MAG: YbjQ family protein [Phormidesmis sp.]